jgi:outer membrane protein assembly factor BamD (BamD/ComL family)
MIRFCAYLYMLCFATMLFSFGCGPGRNTPDAKALQAQLQAAEKTLRTQNPPDTALLRRFVHDAQDLAERFPADTLAPSYLFKAAELLHSTHHTLQAMQLWQDLQKRFPQHPHSAHAAFMMGFSTENDLGDRDQALKFYQAFLQKHPNHHLADDAQLLMDNLRNRVSDDELIQGFEKTK